ncbi:MAG: thioredoxin domain-containing protein [Acidobacteria bacterium]|nr:thioredoxin domain-containing protein [Acidobacteriota bacterium]
MPNRLIHETSPYLQQHAYNPVEWYSWGEEALRTAREEDKPILLSIGYSACHWCHVMEHESFEDGQIAAIMNRYFVNIKVDREERPDLDAIYMNYVQLTTGSGGWPMTVFLTPQQAPFYGGTYFPPDDRYGRPGFRRILEAVAQTYKERKEELAKDAQAVLRELSQMARMPEAHDMLTPRLEDAAFENLAQRFDRFHGGFGTAPKFPASMDLAFLLRYHRRTRHPAALEMVEVSLKKMAQGGVYDHLGGGFHRYSVDERWLVPHFEKMLYDNALLARLYLEAYQVTGNSFYRQVLEETLEFVLREMTHPEGGFYSTLDADVEGEEGKVYLWTPQEIKAVLGEEDARVFCLYYDVTEGGNFEGKNILHVDPGRGTSGVDHDLAWLAQQTGKQEAELEEILRRSKVLLLQERDRRPRPGRDEKVLTAWNGLMIVAFAESASVLRSEIYLDSARRAAEFLLARAREGDRLLRTYKDGQAKLNAYLEDYANLIEALLHLYQATLEPRWLREADRLSRVMVDQFWDQDEGGFFFTGKDHENLIVRHKEFYDNATPSGTSVATLDLLKLALYLDRPDYRQRAEKVLRTLAQALAKFPAGFGYMLQALDFHLGPQREVAIVGDRGQPATRALIEAAAADYFPNKIVAFKDRDPEPEMDVLVPWLKAKVLLAGHPTGYVCQDFACQQPTSDPATLRHQLTA